VIVTVIAIAATAMMCPIGALATMSAERGGCVSSDGPVDAAWTSEQLGNAATIVTVGERLNVPPYGWVIAVATAMQESGLRNLDHGDRDSLGLFQQRPSQGWGAPAQLLDPTYAATKFYEKLLTVAGWQELPLTAAAQRVQVSAYPDAYAKWESDARAVVGIVAPDASC
jgi:hypothetical protein